MPAKPLYLPHQSSLTDKYSIDDDRDCEKSRTDMDMYIFIYKSIVG